jgi:hypothetical protein
MEVVREAFVRVIKGRVEKKLPDNISEIQNEIIQGCGLQEKKITNRICRKACDSVSPLK